MNSLSIAFTRIDFRDQEHRWRACRKIGTNLPRWSRCLKSFSIIGSLETPDSVLTWESLPQSSSSPSFDSLSLEGATTSTDCLASHFAVSPATNAFFAGLRTLIIHLRGEYDKICLPLKVCKNLRQFDLAFEYKDEGSPYQIGEVAAL